MDIDEIIALVSSWEATVVLTPGPGSGAPEIAWGDVFFSYSPDGTAPRAQPFATIVTKDYPDDQTSGLDRPGVFRVNIATRRSAVTALTSAEHTGPPEPDELDRLLPHPVYGPLGWVAVLNPGPRTSAAVRDLLRGSYEAARDRHRRRHDA